MDLLFITDENIKLKFKYHDSVTTKNFQSIAQ
jgi:hypothetical protein